jgi:NADH-quinone oxidoreductase subunit H
MKSVIILIGFGITMLWQCIPHATTKVAAWLQSSVQTGKGGLVYYNLTRWIKIVSKENLNLIPNRFCFFTGPAIAMTAALMTSAVIP